MKNFNVEVWFGPNKTNLVLAGANSANAILIAKKVYPNGRVISAKEIK